MRGIKNYTPKEWLRLDPPIWYLKEIRNKAISRRFVDTRPETLDPFLQRLRHLRGKNIIAVVAFNSPWVIENLLHHMKLRVKDAEIIVCDNSNKPELRPGIEAACRAEEIPYFPLPPNPEKHPCRSHGISLNWIYYNILHPLEPRMFACIDHDLIPYRDVKMADLLNRQPIYGWKKDAPWGWFLWAGYCMFDFSRTRDKAIDFNNDRPALLDTGGQNWKPLYNRLDVRNMRFASHVIRNVAHPASDERMPLEVLDDTWLHLGKVGQTRGRKDYFSDRAQFLSDLFDEVRNGKQLADFIGEPVEI